MEIDQLLKQVERQQDKIKEVRSTFNECSRTKAISDTFINKTAELTSMVEAITT